MAANPFGLGPAQTTNRLFKELSTTGKILTAQIVSTEPHFTNMHCFKFHAQTF